MKVVVCGPRNFTSYNFVEECLKNHDITFLIEGGARGVDSFARQYAKTNGIEFKTFYPDWNMYGKSAGPMRNQHMLDQNPDLVIVIVENGLGLRTGTYNTYASAVARRIPVKLYVKST